MSPKEGWFPPKKWTGELKAVVEICRATVMQEVGKMLGHGANGKTDKKYKKGGNQVQPKKSGKF